MDLAHEASGGGIASLEKTASDSCTRAGSFALLLSLALISLTPYWPQQRREIALHQYLVLRLNLATCLEELEVSPQWQQYKKSVPNAASLPMEQLLKVEVNTVIGTLSSGRFITAMSHFHEFYRASELFGNLNDSQLLADSRAASAYYDYAINRWASKRNTVVERMGGGRSSDGVAPPIDTDWDKLTLADIREIAFFEVPKLSDDTKLNGPLGKEIEIAPGALPRSLYMATMLGVSRR